MYSKSQLFQNIQKNLKLFSPISRNGWIIKLSVYDSNIMLLFNSPITGQSFIKFFEDDEKAVEYINIVISNNSNDLMQLE